MSNQAHWNHVYQNKAPDAVSWFRPQLNTSLDLIRACTLPTNAHIADVGGGASTLVDDLLAQGFTQLSVADISAHALVHSQKRLGEAASTVRWIEGNATTCLFESGSVDLWHDRAVFHFLTDTNDRAQYLSALRQSLKPNAYVILATFGPNGPDKCSGLPIQKYDADALFEQLGEGFTRIDQRTEIHTTPWESTQEFTYILVQFQA